MRLIRDLLRLAGQVLLFGLSARRPALVVLVVLGIAVSALSLFVTAATPVALYPFL